MLQWSQKTKHCQLRFNIKPEKKSEHVKHMHFWEKQKKLYAKQQHLEWIFSLVLMKIDAGFLFMKVVLIPYFSPCSVITGHHFDCDLYSHGH